MIIRRDQIDAMRKEFLNATANRLCARLASEQIPVNIDTRQVSELIDDAAGLGITEEEQIYRLLRFRCLIVPVLGDPLIQSVIIRILHNFAWSAEKRLIFLEEQLLPRTRRTVDVR